MKRGLLPWIIAFKAFKAITLIVLGVTLVATRHADTLDLLVRMALAIHLPLTSRILERALAIAVNLSVTEQTALGVTAFAYAGLMGTEAIALWKRKGWARWLTIVATCSLIPFELYELTRELNAVRALALLANIGVVIYLVKRRELFE